MSTDQLLAYFQNKKLLPLDMMESYFFDYLKGIVEADLAATYRADGVFDAVATVTGPATGQVSVPGAFNATDGIGHKFEFGATDSRLQTVPFQNTNAVTYHMGLRSVEPVDELDINPRAGQPEYRRRKENIGTLGTPDAVVDNGANITLTVDAVTESGVTHAGRTVRVYLVAPKATSWANAYEDVTVAWTAGANKITTTGLLGQTAGSVSTTPADYVVVEIGPVIVRQATLDLKTASGVCFLAEFDGVTGSPPTPSMTDQNILTGSLSDLADITRIANSDLKVSVRAVPADTGEDQVRVESSGGSRMWGVDEAGKHWLPDAAEGRTLDDSGYFGALGLPWNSGSFAGSINELAHTLSLALGPIVLSGFEYSSSGSGNFIMTTGAAYVPAADGLTGGAIQETDPTLAISDGTRWVYLDPSTGPTATATKATAYGAGCLPLFRVVMSGGSASSITDIAYRAGQITKDGIITVSSGAASSNFVNLQAALDFVDYMMDQDSARWPGVEVWILDDMDVGAQAAIVGTASDGLVIRGVNWRGAAAGRSKLYYGDSNADLSCVEVLADDVRFIGLMFECQRTGGTGASSGVFATPGGGTIKGTRFDGCRFTSNNSNLAFGVRKTGAGDWDEVQFYDCVFDLANTTPTNVAVAEALGDDCKFIDCVINGSTKTALAYLAGLLDSHWDRCVFNALNDSAIVQNVASRAVRAKFTNCSGSLGDIQNGEFLNCRFTTTTLTPSDAYDEIIFIGGSIGAADMITNDHGARITMIGVELSVLTGTYLIDGTAVDELTMIRCRTGAAGSNILSGGVVITLADHCTLAHCQFGKFRTSTNQGIAFIEIEGADTQVINCDIDASYYTECINITATGIRCRIADNEITNPTSYNTGTTAIGVLTAADSAIIQGNHIHDIGDGTNGGLGLHTIVDYNIIQGNRFENIDGAAIHIAAAALGNVIQGNSMITVGLAVVTNPKTGAVSAHGIHCWGDRNVISNNVVMTVVDDGIHLGNDAKYNAIVGNITAAEGGDGIELAIGADSNTMIGNNTQGGVADNGAANVLGGADTNI